MASYRPLDLSFLKQPPQPVPITVLTGFLGSGKTTLLNHMLNAEHGLRIAVLVNDFGDINIDSQMVMDVKGENVISLENGCVCCTIRGDLLDAVLNLFTLPDLPEYIVIEASGVSYPAEVARTFLLPDMVPFLSVDSILALIDTEQVLSLTGEPAMLAIDQVSMSDIVILNKADLVDAEQIETVREWVRNIVPISRILEASYADVPLEFILSTGAYSPERLADLQPGEVHVHQADSLAHVHPDHAMVFHTWSFVSDQPLAFRAVREVIQALPANIIRAKGLLYFSEVPDQRGIFQLAGKRVSLHLAGPWGAQSPRTQLVFISTEEDIDTLDLQLRFESCRAEYMDPDEGDLTIEEIEDWIRTQ